MKSKLTKQEQRVYNYIVAHRGATTKDIERDLGITCPSARITYLRDKGVNIKSIGQKKYEGSRAFECYAIEDAQPAYKTEYHFDADRNVVVEVRVPITS
jgi:helix-turn-helix protein